MAVSRGIAAANLVIQVLAVQVLLHQVGRIFLVAEVEDGDDVRVLEAGGDFRFAKEAHAQLVVGEGAGLDRHLAVEVGIETFVDLAEAAGADFLDDPVLAERRRFHAST